MDKHYLTPLLSPNSIVVLAGAADAPEGPTAQAQALRKALQMQRYDGSLQFLDVRSTGTLAQLAQTRVDLAIIALPAAEMAAALEVTGRIGCRAALVISHGLNAESASLLKRTARRENIHLLGPNSLGFQRPGRALNASIAGPLAKAGPLALVSQSGALTASMLDWAQKNAVGFSSVVSLGPHTAVDIAQVLDFLAHDAATHSIIVYLEGITNARRFMSALRTASSAKPVVVLKAGRRPAGNEAAQTHSASIVGSDDVFDAALRRAGAVRVRSFVELFSAAKCLASRYRPVGKRLAIVTNGGGPGQDQDGQFQAAVAPAGQPLHAVAARQAQIQHHRVEGRGREGRIGENTIAEPVHHVPELAQARCDRVAQQGVVFHDQDAHGGSRNRPVWRGRLCRSPPTSPRSCLDLAQTGHRDLD